MKIHLGCGQKILEGYVNVDKINYGQEKVMDAMEYLQETAMTPGIADEIKAEHFLEHFSQEDVIRILNFAHLILKENGEFKIVVPSIKRGEAYYIVHKTLFTLETFTMLSSKEYCDPYKIFSWQKVSGVVNDRGDLHVCLVK